MSASLQFVPTIVDQATKNLSVVVIHLLASFNSSPPAVGAGFHVSPVVLLPVLAVVPFGGFTRTNEEHDARQSAEYNGANVGGGVSLHFVSYSLSKIFSSRASSNAAPHARGAPLHAPQMFTCLV